MTLSHENSKSMSLYKDSQIFIGFHQHNFHMTIWIDVGTTVVLFPHVHKTISYKGVVSPN